MSSELLQIPEESESNNNNRHWCTPGSSFGKRWHSFEQSTDKDSAEIKIKLTNQNDQEIYSDLINEIYEISETSEQDNSNEGEKSDTDNVLNNLIYDTNSNTIEDLFDFSVLLSQE
ncbi:19523_t:CDS:2 [Racocetra fulgida]|uniref:19523_t:CDS:1 n=1 Tax=Racocetra fulgida TaxID=60492 RepID=A0A9N9DL84_9GLOM|nr:19523_t:CDS:2 [Racocetra fulgida]